MKTTKKKTVKQPQPAADEAPDMLVVIRLGKADGGFNSGTIERAQAPTKIHFSMDDAISEQCRLCEQHPGVAFGVFALLGTKAAKIEVCDCVIESRKVPSAPPVDPIMQAIDAVFNDPAKARAKF